MTDFDRAAVEAEIATLEREQGACLLDGREFDTARLSDARSTLEANIQAAAEAERRRREQDTANKTARRTELREDAALIAADYTKALNDAEAAAAALLVALKRILDDARTLSLIATQLGIRPSHTLAPEALEQALSLAIGQALSRGGEKHRRFGYLGWPDAVTPPTFAALASIIPNFEEGA